MPGGTGAGEAATNGEEGRGEQGQPLASFG